MAPPKRGNNSEDHSNSLWVFGYGSLCWRPGFEFGDSVIGHIQGFSRKFWQGNTTHRGTPEKVIPFEIFLISNPSKIACEIMIGPSYFVLISITNQQLGGKTRLITSA